MHVKEQKHDIFMHIHKDIKLLLLSRKIIREFCNRSWDVIVVISHHLIKLRQNILKFTFTKNDKFKSLYTKKRTYKIDVHPEAHWTAKGTNYLRYLLISPDFNSQEFYLIYPALSCYD